MAEQQQETEIPQNLTIPPPETLPATTKRHRGDNGDATEQTADADLPAPKRRVLSTHDILFRIIVPSRQIGKVIGKVGTRIQKIREQTKATIKIADAVARHEERVIIISSKDNDDTFCDAENALHQIATLILQDDGTTEAFKVGIGHLAVNAIRLLIAGSQAGCLIGHSGQKIETLRNSSGATITVLDQNQLPLCASAHESDRVVQISGDVPVVMKALVEIGSQLRDNPPSQVISFSPTYNLPVRRAPQKIVDPNSAEYVTLVMMISETMVGGLIGRSGSNISRIRTESGATIKVHGGKGEQKLREIHLGGSSQQVALAKQRVDEYIYSQMMQESSVGPQLVDSGAGMMPVGMIQGNTRPPHHAPFFMPTASNQAPPQYYGPPFHAPQF